MPTGTPILTAVASEGPANSRDHMEVDSLDELDANIPNIMVGVSRIADELIGGFVILEMPIPFNNL